jgi:hypothetical protein
MSAHADERMAYHGAQSAQIADSALDDTRHYRKLLATHIDRFWATAPITSARRSERIAEEW